MNMKKNLSKWIWMVLIYPILNYSCTESNVSNPLERVGQLRIETIDIGNLTFKRLSGSISQDITLTRNTNWLLDGGVLVLEGANLTIESGTSIFAGFNEETSFLSVQRGGTINAQGTATDPIFFTSIRKLTSVPQPGDWGGIIVNGSAPINLDGGVGEGEGGTGSYGGTDPNDNSGVLRYVIIEYGGKQLGEDNELNGLSLNGVGNGTTVEFVEVLYGLDDGFELFGGTVNLRYAVSLGNGDDSFDWTYGWSGFGQFWVAQQDPFDGDRGIEADNNEDNFDALPFSNPTVANVTLIGANDGDPDNDGIVLRHGTKGRITNALVVNFSQHGLQVAEESAGFIETDELSFLHSRVFDNAVVDEEAGNYTNADAFQSEASNTVEDQITLAGFVGSEAIAFDPATIDSWFLSAPYVGAVPADNNWTANWVEILR